MGAGASVFVNTSSQKETEKMKTRTMKSVRGKVAETVVPEEGEYRISTGSRPCLTSETYNAGTFALVRIMPKGLIIVFQ